jgi:hypothetical protein
MEEGQINTITIPEHGVYPVGESPLGCGLGQGRALRLHRSLIHSPARFDSPTKQ